MSGVPRALYLGEGHLMGRSMDEGADDVAAVEIVEPLATAFAMALNTTFQVLGAHGYGPKKY